MEEKLYLFNEDEDEEEIEEQVKAFFDELVNRKTNNKEGGLQAVMVALEDKAGAKVCENDGLGNHEQSYINVVKALRGKNDFLSLGDVEFPQKYLEDGRYLFAHGFEVRIISGVDLLQITINGARYSELTDFQKDTIKKIVERCRIIRDDNNFEMIELGVAVGENINVEVDKLTDDLIERIYESLGSKQMTQ